MAILGCVGMILFECIFIFELYDRAVEQSASPAPVIKTPEAAPVSNAIPAVSVPAEVPATSVVPVETNAPGLINTVPVKTNSVSVVPVG